MGSVFFKGHEGQQKCPEGACASSLGGGGGDAVVCLARFAFWACLDEHSERGGVFDRPDRSAQSRGAAVSQQRDLPDLVGGAHRLVRRSGAFGGSAYLGGAAYQ